MTLARFLTRRLPQADVDFMVTKVTQELSGLSGLEQIILFGSAARGDMTDASDLDLVLVFSTPDEAKQGSKVARARRKPPHVPCDLICVDRRSFDERSAIGGVLMIAMDEGRVIYQHNG